jgi:dipeptidyl aminopeptidase/acylaminoacyl peptidase
MNEERLRQVLRDAPVPDEREAEERARRLVRTAYAATTPRRESRPLGRRGLQLAVAFGLIAALVSPAGATVRHWVSDAVEDGREPSRPALTSLPAPGALLVDSTRGPWVVREDGSKRLLGAYRQSTWSPRGLFVTATGAHQLVALDPGGEVRWTLARSGLVRDPAWSPDGYRIAYLNGSALRVVAADGTGDRELEPRVAPVTPAWRPSPRHVVAFADAAGRVRAVDTDSGGSVFRTPSGLRPTRLAWSGDGARLLVVQRSELRLLDRSGDLLWRRPSPPGMEFITASPIPGADRVAAIAAVSDVPSRSELLLLGPDTPPTLLFSGPGRFSEVVSSPDGEWLLLAWRSADQWLFLDLARSQRVVAVSGISAQFNPGTTSPPSFPEIAGWCCP